MFPYPDRKFFNIERKNFNNDRKNKALFFRLRAFTIGE